MVTEGLSSNFLTHQKKFDDLTDEKINFVQDNVSVSKKNVLRGLHFQNPPFVEIFRGVSQDVYSRILLNLQELNFF